MQQEEDVDPLVNIIYLKMMSNEHANAILETLLNGSGVFMTF